MKPTCQTLCDMKKNGTAISVITAYDAPTARLAVEAGIDLLLVGDSVGTNVLGYANETEVTMDDMVHHVKAVARSAPQSCIIADLPFGAADNPADACRNARVLVDAGTDIVKLEGWSDKVTVVEALCREGFSVCGHIGYNPQVHGQKAKVFGRDYAVAKELLDSAKKLEDAGAGLIVVEKVPEEVCRLITESLAIPIIGIGSGRYCDGQVLVFHDVVGLTGRSFRHAKAYIDGRNLLKAALITYNADIKEHRFPGPEQVSHVSDEIIAQLRPASD